jgi:hypothetical protein
MRRIVLSMAIVGAVLAGVAGSALGASPVFLCVPSTAGASVTSGGSTGTCSTGTPVALPSEKAEQEKLISILPDMKYVKEGVDKKPTVQFSGVNLQVINGSGAETTVNGTGNLILGYDEKPKTQSGSHNLLLGGIENSYSSYGAIVGGAHNNTSSGPYASVLSGAENTATGTSSVITGGHSNKTNSSYSTIAGGCGNFAGAGTYAVSTVCTTAYANDFAAILGGAGNQAEAENSTILGGKSIAENGVYGVSAGLSEAEQNKLFAIVPHLGYEVEGIDKKPTVQFSGANVQVLSGTGNTNGTPNGEGNLVVGYDEEPGAQTGMNNLVVGGSKQSFTSYGALVGGSGNTASGPSTDVFGIENVATLDGASVTGGAQNTASGYFSSVSGGYGNVASDFEASVSGGTENEAGGEASSVSGGDGNKALGNYDSVSGGASNTDEPASEVSSILGGANQKLAGTYEIYPAGP